jgi:hypothetical protein
MIGNQIGDGSTGSNIGRTIHNIYVIRFFIAIDFTLHRKFA